jgi:hypothetical protein
MEGTTVRICDLITFWWERVKLIKATIVVLEITIVKKVAIIKAKWSIVLQNIKKNKKIKVKQKICTNQRTAIINRCVWARIIKIFDKNIKFETNNKRTRVLADFKWAI